MIVIKIKPAVYPTAKAKDPKGIRKDDVLPDGTQVKAGGMVTYVPYSMGRMEYDWGADAASFRPERWFQDGVLQNVSPFPFKFTAFQAGPGICFSFYLSISRRNESEISPGFAYSFHTYRHTEVQDL
ncbi:hypothetical protein IEQ34_023400 [Dendrobium chrysotoxum]|uniref:noroxomaritidine synthase n=1 Tax=Dendrobium chrysotoxum TaxID=161865 RepID=A0AAV7FS90_DENCH|nr:hypothetical protein IEQ34_026082 [Dendrobium chrysotoxum]KAH0440135.1 hypothetical protein IEQ34_025682 [Dendrobium chrysotoxum]KAH0440181.1 hypothetical protein IEQ34_025728 [Dendrobium chrysotoxum]KAH0440544.1 hypothetical protein IEQ34_025567 [Dendrobium chrysotoxum]KAH0445483.1 hypothetical protein IEQ34_025440 [Dendrobium chrysotoxum]